MIIDNDYPMLMEYEDRYELAMLHAPENVEVMLDKKLVVNKSVRVFGDIDMHVDFECKGATNVGGRITAQNIILNSCRVTGKIISKKDTVITGTALVGPIISGENTMLKGRIYSLSSIQSNGDLIINGELVVYENIDIGGDFIAEGSVEIHGTIKSSEFAINNESITRYSRFIKGGIVHIVYNNIVFKIEDEEMSEIDDVLFAIPDLNSIVG